MLRRNMKRYMITFALLMLFLWPIFQMYDLAQGEETKNPALPMLYEVSVFQMDLLTSYLGDAAQISSTGELDSLKQAAYAMNFTHDKLVEALESQEAPPLEFASSFLEFIVRMQMGGDRALRKEEQKQLKKLAEHSIELYEAYENLVTPDGEVDGAYVELLKEKDEELVHILQTN